MCINGFSNFVHKYFIIIRHLHIINLIILCLHPGELASQSSDVIDQVVYRYMQFIDAERFSDEGVCTTF